MNEQIRDVVIVGAGLSGLATAYGLAKAGIDVHVIEATEKHGGRIQSIIDAETKSVLADLGPTWVWPHFQPIVVKWAQQLGLELVPQYDEGMGIYEAGPDTANQRLVFPKQQGIERIIGGPQRIVDRLVEGLDPRKLQFNSPVSSIRRKNGIYNIKIQNGEAKPVLAKRIVLASPLRLSWAIDGMNGLIPEETMNLMQASPTWMATHAKVSIVYDKPFWRDAGLSGRVASRIGPLMEIHDISGEDGSPAALFGFCGITPEMRDQVDLEAAVIDQLIRCFGKDAASPIALQIMDWAREEFICSEADRHGAMSHPEVLPEDIRHPYQNNSLFFGVSETASSDPGLIAGAFAAADRVVRHLCA